LPFDTPKFIIDKNPPYVPAHHNFHVIKKSATEGMQELKMLLMRENK